MKYNIENIIEPHQTGASGSVVKSDERYIVKDNTTLKNLILSSTDLFPYKSTSGHSHIGQEEIYHFVKGSGVIELNEVPINVEAGDIVLIEDGVFHKVTAGEEGLYFVCVFDGKRNH